MSISVYFFFNPLRWVRAVFQSPVAMHPAIACLQSAVQLPVSPIALQNRAHFPFNSEQLFPVICAMLGVATKINTEVMIKKRMRIILLRCMRILAGCG
jgi:hypothetical protein